MPPGPVSCIGGIKYPHCIVLYCITRESSQSSRQDTVCIRDQWRDLAVGWLTSLVPCIYSAWLRDIVSLSVQLHTWLTERPSARHAHSTRRRSCARQITCSDSHDQSLLTIPWHRLYHAPVFMVTAVSHRLKTTLVNHLCQPEKLISRHIRKKYRPSIPPWCRAQNQACIGSWPRTSNIVV